MPQAKQGTHPIYQDYAEALDLVESKAHDYAEDDNVFSNFEFAAQVAGVKTEQVFAVLLGVKVARLGQLIGNNKTPNFESIDDTLLDTMNYAGLLRAYLRQQADNMTIPEALDAAVEEGWDIPDIKPTPEEIKRAKLPGGPLHGVREVFAIGDVVRRAGTTPEKVFTYVVTELRPPWVLAVPTMDWHEQLGKQTRSFKPSEITLA